MTWGRPNLLDQFLSQVCIYYIFVSFTNYYYRASACTPAPAYTYARTVWLPPLCGMFLFSFCLLTIITSVPHAHPSHIHHAAQWSACLHALAQCGLALFRYFFSFFPSTSYSYMTPATLAHTCNHMLGRTNTRHDHPYTPTWHGSRLYVSFGLFFVV